MSNFASHSKLLSEAVNQHFGTIMRITPSGNVDNFGNAVDPPARSEVVATATFLDGKAAIGFLDGDRKSSNFSARISSQDIIASFARSAFAIDNLPRKNDTLTVLETGQSYFVIDTVNTGEDRISCILVKH